MFTDWSNPHRENEKREPRIFTYDSFTRIYCSLHVLDSSHTFHSVPNAALNCAYPITARPSKPAAENHFQIAKAN